MGPMGADVVDGCEFIMGGVSVLGLVWGYIVLFNAGGLYGVFISFCGALSRIRVFLGVVWVGRVVSLLSCLRVGLFLCSVGKVYG